MELLISPNDPLHNIICLIIGKLCCQADTYNGEHALTEILIDLGITFMNPKVGLVKSISIKEEQLSYLLLNYETGSLDYV